MLFTWFSILSSRILLPLFSCITLDLYRSSFQILVRPSRDPLVRPFNLISDNALLLWNGKGVIVLKDELFTTKEIQWFTLRLYKNNHNILNMDLYSLVPRERPRLKSYGAFLWNSKSGFSNPKGGCFFPFRLDYQPLLEKRARARPRERAEIKPTFLWALKNWCNISVFKLCFVGFYIYSGYDFRWLVFFRLIWGSKENLLLMEEMKNNDQGHLSVWVVEQVESYK